MDGCLKISFPTRVAFKTYRSFFPFLLKASFTISDGSNELLASELCMDLLCMSSRNTKRKKKEKKEKKIDVGWFLSGLVPRCPGNDLQESNERAFSCRVGSRVCFVLFSLAVEKMCTQLTQRVCIVLVGKIFLLSLPFSLPCCSRFFALAIQGSLGGYRRGSSIAAPALFWKGKYQNANPVIPPNLER